MNTKVCPKCGEEKSLSDFGKDTTKSSGYQSHCKTCKFTWRQAHRQREEVKMYEASYMRKWALDKKYGITLDEYDDLLELQGNCCAVCGAHIDNAKLGAARHFYVDHNHNTGEVRGLLCSPCNTALGLFQDSPSILQSALNYLNNRGFYGS